MRNSHLAIGDVIDINIKKIGINGEGIGYYDNLAVFVEYGLPSEDLKVRITKVFDNRATAEIEEIITESPDRVEPFCPKYYECGGCQLQHLRYEKTLEIKRDLVIESMIKYYDKNFKQSLVKPTIGAENNIHYRNKASLPVKYQRGKNKVGIYKMGTNHFVEIGDCPIQMKSVNECLKDVTRLMDKHEIDAFDIKTKRGYVKALSVRANQDETQLQVSFIMVKYTNKINTLVKELVKMNKRVVSVFLSINTRAKEQTFFTPEIEKLYGSDTLEVTLDNHKFLIKPDAFFQLNYGQASTFYNKIKGSANLTGKETVIDGFAGAATISHYLADKAKKIYAIELDKASVQSGIVSLENNEITNVSMIEGDFFKALSGLKRMEIDLLVFDPPRAGLGKGVVEGLKKYKINKIIYGSCSPITLAKDVKRQDGFEVGELQPLDMFPWTSHVEMVVTLKFLYRTEHQFF